jgi:site-specific DNA recombinase
VLWILGNQAYVGRVHWREQTFPGIHEPLIDTDTFDHAQALLKERGEDMAMRAASRAEFLLTGLIRCGRCRRAYVGMSAKGNGGTYHYYACSGRQKLGRKSCDGERLPKDKLEAAILHQLTGLYRDGTLIRNAIEQAAASDETDRAALTEKRASLAKEIARAECAIERYQDAFENGDLDPARFKQRLSALDARLDALQGPVNSPQTRPPRRIRPPCTPSPTNSITSSPTVSPSKPRRYSESSSPTCASTAARKSCPPTASALPWFAHRQVQWTLAG